MTEGVDDPDEQVTMGSPTVVMPKAAGRLFVGPPEDPDRFELLDDGTRGGEGRTWRAAYRGGLNHPLVQAVKMLFPPAGTASDWPTEDDVRRWHDHATLLRHLAQPHVVALHDIFAGVPPHTMGTASEHPARTVAYLLMEWVDGPTLATRVQGEPVTAETLPERLRFIEEIATAVAALHSHTRSAGNPVLHRDLTPTNCLVHESRGIVVIDISGMRLIEDGFDPWGRHTPAYTSPEVLHAPHAPREPSSDLFAVGAVTVFCLTGDDPPPGDREALDGRLTAMLRTAGVARPQAAATHVLQMLEPEPQRRPTDVRAWSRTLTSLAAPTCAAPPPPSFPRRHPLAIAVAVVLAAAVAVTGVVVTQRAEGSTPPTAAGIVPPVAANEGVFPQADFASPEGRIISPTSGQEVRDCEYFTGTAKLQPGQTLVLAMHDVANPIKTRYIQVIFGFDHPETLETWRGAQYFNRVGHRFMVELIELPLTETLNETDDTQSYDESGALASHGRVLAAVTVVRGAATNPAHPCPEQG